MLRSLRLLQCQLTRPTKFTLVAGLETAIWGIGVGTLCLPHVLVLCPLEQHTVTAVRIF